MIGSSTYLIILILKQRAWIASLLLIAFEIVTVILLMNLMISLAVGDVSKLRASAEEELLKIKTNYCINTLYWLEPEFHTLDKCHDVYERFKTTLLYKWSPCIRFTEWCIAHSCCLPFVRFLVQKKKNMVVINKTGNNIFSASSEDIDKLVVYPHESIRNQNVILNEL